MSGIRVTTSDTNENNGNGGNSSNNGNGNGMLASTTWHAMMSTDDRKRVCQHLMTKMKSLYSNVTDAALRQWTVNFEKKAFVKAYSRDEYLELIAKGLAEVENLSEQQRLKGSDSSNAGNAVGYTTDVNGMTNGTQQLSARNAGGAAANSAAVGGGGGQLSKTSSTSSRGGKKLTKKQMQQQQQQQQAQEQAALAAQKQQQELQQRQKLQHEQQAQIQRQQQAAAAAAQLAAQQQQQQQQQQNAQQQQAGLPTQRLPPKGNNAGVGGRPRNAPPAQQGSSPAATAAAGAPVPPGAASSGTHSGMSGLLAQSVAAETNAATSSGLSDRQKQAAALMKQQIERMSPEQLLQWANSTKNNPRAAAFLRRAAEVRATEMKLNQNQGEPSSPAAAPVPPPAQTPVSVTAAIDTSVAPSVASRGHVAARGSPRGGRRGGKAVSAMPHAATPDSTTNAARIGPLGGHSDANTIAAARYAALQKQQQQRQLQQQQQQQIASSNEPHTQFVPPPPSTTAAVAGTTASGDNANLEFWQYLELMQRKYRTPLSTVYPRLTQMLEKSEKREKFVRHLNDCINILSLPRDAVLPERYSIKLLKQVEQFIQMVFKNFQELERRYNMAQNNPSAVNEQSHSNVQPFIGSTAAGGGNPQMFQGGGSGTAATVGTVGAGGTVIGAGGTPETMFAGMSSAISNGNVIGNAGRGGLQTTSSTSSRGSASRSNSKRGGVSKRTPKSKSSSITIRKQSAAAVPPPTASQNQSLAVPQNTTVKPPISASAPSPNQSHLLAPSVAAAAASGHHGAVAQPQQQRVGLTGPSVKERLISMENSVKRALEVSRLLPSLIDDEVKRRRKDRVSSTFQSMVGLIWQQSASLPEKRQLRLSVLGLESDPSLSINSASITTPDVMESELYCERVSRSLLSTSQRRLRDKVEAECTAAQGRNPTLVLDLWEELGLPVICCSLLIPQVRFPNLLIRASRMYTTGEKPVIVFERPCLGWIGVLECARNGFLEKIKSNPKVLSIAEILDCWAREAENAVTNANLVSFTTVNTLEN
eukprot:CAMPEP_0182444290 /NCGR_PEP_ID=MMETSP1172-20130603/2789_1 /TAXON_ID=708627 /ORGANISM="Timspurckia oligopyrenoides, Strain CCMP3278" /LENGTH=1040 /DNA_ID=CAMNT_0024639815 /DNA_START=142 /DNA_END=3264 /DNA_ORIENTATION=-